jgi:two-component system cell cycle response regulator DivK
VNRVPAGGRIPSPKEPAAVGAAGGTVEGSERMALDFKQQHRNIAQTTQKRVLIVEDNELNMKLFNDLLEAHGYFTLQTKDGVEALRMARAHRPDLILMDIQLPEVSGLEVTKWLKEDDELRSIPIIAVTAFAMKGDEQKIRDGGCEAYIAKPISVASFMSTVERFLS